MISPQEAESRVFTKASFGSGYNMAQVDTFLDELISDYAGMYKENAALKGKMKVLAEKLEEYRATEDAMRRTLLSAQKMADNMLQEAEAQKSEAIAKANTEAKTQMEEIRRELKNEETRLAAARSSTAIYVEKLKTLYTNELEYIGRLSEMTDTPGEPVSDPVREIEDKLSEIMIAAKAESASAEASPAPAAQEAPAQDEPPAASFDEPEGLRLAADQKVVPLKHPDEDRDTSSDTVVFDRLEFGKDYQFE